MNTADNALNMTKYYRVRNIVREEYVEFDFSIGDPALFVELVMPIPAFEQFCRQNGVVELTEEQCRAVDEEANIWRCLSSR